MSKMLIEEQKVKVSWNSKNINHYQKRGYKFSKIWESFYVNVDDLMDNSNMYIKLVCDYCGEEFETKYQHYKRCKDKNQKDACGKCMGVKNADVTLNDRANSLYLKLIKKCEEFGYELLTSNDELKTTRDKIKYICPIHGIHEVRADGLIQGKQCPKCANIIKIKKSKQTSLPRRQQSLYDRIIDICKENNYTLITKKDEIINNSMYITYNCSFHGEHKMRIYNFLSGERCPDCVLPSKGEEKIKNILNTHNIKYFYQHKFSDCKDKRLLPFDFYLPKCNLCIEYQGQQHYETVKYFGGEEKFKIQQKHDNLKREYCENNSIELLEIPYWEFNNIENILNKKISLHEDIV